MPEQNVNLATQNLAAIQEGLVKATEILSKETSVVGNKALEELINANQSLTRAVRILVFDNTCQLNASQLAILQRPIYDLHLDLRPRKACLRVPALILNDGLPVKLTAGLPIIGEIVQLTEADFLIGKNFGMRSLTNLQEKLTAIGFKLGMILSDDDLASAKVDRLRSAENALNSGVIEEFRYGQYVEQRGGVDVLNKSVRTIKNVEEELLDIRVKGVNGAPKPLSTIAELVQIPLTTSPFSRSTVFSLLEYLIPKGLCLDMSLSDEKLSALGMKRITISRPGRNTGT